MSARNPQAEATHLVGRPARVLEPSPPAVDDGEWYADDPAASDGSEVTPTSAGAVTWTDLAATDSAVASFAAEHWLGAYKALEPIPAGYAASRDDYHRLAYAVVSNARKQATGKFGLRYTRGGFGTPFFGNDEQVRVEGTQLIRQAGNQATTTTITTLAAAAEFVGTVANDEQAEGDTVALGDVDRPLDVRQEVGQFLGDWFGFGTSVLEETRLLGRHPAHDTGRVQIWPGHFDPAMEIGNAEAQRRATYGASPGDASSAEPYLYVGPWGDLDPSEPFWNATGFTGASLAYADLLSADDPREKALTFFRRGFDLLHS